MAPRDWGKLLRDPSGDAVVRLTGAPGELAAAESAAEKLAFFRTRIDAKDAPDKGRLLAEFSRAFRFPDYFGANWDALFDCLTDLVDFRPAPGWLVVILDPERLRGEDQDVLLKTLEAAASYWRDRRPPRCLKVLLVPAPESLL